MKRMLLLAILVMVFACNVAGASTKPDCQSILQTEAESLTALRIIIAETNLSIHDLKAIQSGKNPLKLRRDELAIIYSPLIEDILKNENPVIINEEIRKIISQISQNEAVSVEAKIQTADSLNWLILPAREIKFLPPMGIIGSEFTASVVSIEISLMAFQCGHSISAIEIAQCLKQLNLDKSFHYRLATLNEFFSLVISTDRYYNESPRISGKKTSETNPKKVNLSYHFNCFNAVNLAKDSLDLFIRDTDVPVHIPTRGDLYFSEGGVNGDISRKHLSRTLLPLKYFPPESLSISDMLSDTDFNGVVKNYFYLVRTPILAGSRVAP